MKRAGALAALLLAGTASADVAAPRRDGKTVFAQVCACCHGDDGRGHTDYGKTHGCPDFTSAEWMAKHTEADLTDSVTNGQLEAEMPAFGKQLSAADIKAVVAYIQKLPKPGAAAPKK